MILRSKRKMVLFGMLLFFLLCLGCGGGNGVDRITLSGKVTFAGKPLPYGLIYFLPDRARGNQGPQGYAEIVDGKYSTDEVGMGAITGPLVIQISGFSQKNTDSEMTSKPLFPTYQMKIELEKDTQTLDFEVPTIK